AGRPRLPRVRAGALPPPPNPPPPRQLVGDALGDERGVELRLLDLLDVEVDLGVARDLQQTGAQAVGLGAAAPDHDPRPRGVHVDPQAVARALDLDPAHGRVRELASQIVADLPVLDHRLLVVVLVGEPVRLAVGGDAEADPVGVVLLAHYSSLFFFVVFLVAFCGFLAVVFLAVPPFFAVDFFAGFLVAGAFFFAGACFAGSAPSGWASAPVSAPSRTTARAAGPPVA